MPKAAASEQELHQHDAQQYTAHAGGHGVVLVHVHVFERRYTHTHAKGMGSTRSRTVGGGQKNSRGEKERKKHFGWYVCAAACPTSLPAKARRQNTRSPPRFTRQYDTCTDCSLRFPCVPFHALRRYIERGRCNTYTRTREDRGGGKRRQQSTTETKTHTCFPSADRPPDVRVL